MPTRPTSTRPYWMRPRKAHSWSRAEHYDFLNSSVWRDNARAYRMANPLCVECEKEGRAEPATQVDHIVEAKDGGDLMSWDNLQSLCKRHHLAKTMKERARRAKADKGRGASRI